MWLVRQITASHFINEQSLMQQCPPPALLHISAELIAHLINWVLLLTI